MSSAVEVAGIAASVSLIVALVNVLYNHTVQLRTTRQTLTLRRWKAYAGYLVAQQALHLVLRNVKKTHHIRADVAYDEYLNQRRDSDDKELYIQSGDAEMRARLLADPKVGKAISCFEKYVEEAIKHRLVPSYPKDGTQALTLYDTDWDRHLLILVKTMNDEQIADWWGKRRRRLAPEGLPSCNLAGSEAAS